MAIAAADLLKDRVTPFLAEHRVSLLRVVTDLGTAYRVKVENHTYRLYLAVEDLDQSKTKANRPPMKDFCARFHRTFKDTF